MYIVHYTVHNVNDMINYGVTKVYIEVVKINFVVYLVNRWS